MVEGCGLEVEVGQVEGEVDGCPDEVVLAIVYEVMLGGFGVVAMDEKAGCDHEKGDNHAAEDGFLEEVEGFWLKESATVEGDDEDGSDQL